MNREQYPQQNTARMEKILGSSSQNGLTSKEAKERLKKNGKNTLGDERDGPLLAFLKAIFKNATLPIALLGFGASAFLIGAKVLVSLAFYLAFILLYFFFYLRRENYAIEQR